MTIPAPVTEHTLRRDLQQIADLWPLLLDPAKATTTGGRHTRPDRTPAPTVALSIRRELCEVLASWVHLAMDDLGADPTGLDSQDGAALARWLDPWCADLATHEAATDLGAELEQWAARMESVALGAKRHRIDLDHPCPVIEDGLPCPGTLVAVARYDEPDASDVHCTTAAHHRWPVADWTSLGHLLAPGGVALVTIKEAAALTDLPPATVKKWVQRERVLRYPGGKDGGVLVDYHEVCRVATRESMPA